MHLTEEPYINNGNMLHFLSCLSDELLNLSGGKRVDILIVGGSALALKYNFRATVDIDADIRYVGRVTEAINSVAMKQNIPSDWINQEFTKSSSYSRYLWDDAKLVVSYNEFFNVYVVSDLSQLCMKAISGRDKDVSDIKFLVEKLKGNGYNYYDYKKQFYSIFRDLENPNPYIEKLVRKNFDGRKFIDIFKKK